MAEVPTLVNLSNLQNETTAVNAINSNSAAIGTAFLDVLSRSGVAPNQMNASLDMNSNRVLNLVSPASAGEPLRLQDLMSFIGGTVNFPATASNVTFVPTGSISSTNVQAAIQEVVAELATAIVPQSPITKTTIQAAIDLAQSQGGGIVLLPQGAFSIDTSTGPLNVTGTQSIIIEGEGANTTDGTVLVSSTAAGDMFNITATGNVVFRNFCISTAITKSVNTNAIKVDTAGTSAGTVKIFTELWINGYYTGINILDSVQFSIVDNLITNFTGYGIQVEQPDTTDAGVGVIEYNRIWDIGGTAGATAGLLWLGGSGLRVNNNRFLGAFNYGMRATLNNTVSDDGAFIVTGNTFEVQNLYGIYIDRTAGAAAAGRKIGQLVISNNHIQCLTSGYQNAIAIESSAPGGWVQGAVISDNIIQNTIAAPLNSAMIRIDDGDLINVSNNVIYNTGAGAGGIRAAGNSTNVTITNNSINGTVANRYPSINSSSVVTDVAGITFAALPTPGNGSIVYVTDGTPGNPITGSGTGCLGLRVNGAWKSESDAYIAANNTWTGSNTFSGAGTLTINVATIFNVQLSVLDANLSIKDNVDPTKILQFQASGITTGTTRTITIPDASGTLGLLGSTQSWTGINSFTNTTNATTAATGGVVLSGGLGVAKDAWFGGSIFNFGTGSTSIGAATEVRISSGSGQSSGLIFSSNSVLTGYFSVAAGGVAFFSGGAIPLQFGVNNGGQILINAAATNINYSITTDATSSSTGAATFAGGIGALKNIYSGQAILSSGPTNGIGYAIGAGGAVTQLTSRTTGVTINKVCGQITMLSAAGSATAATFTVTNSTVAATDVIHLSQASGTNLYNFLATAAGSGTFNITFFTTGGTATDAPVINFAITKGVTS